MAEPRACRLRTTVVILAVCLCLALVSGCVGQSQSVKGAIVESDPVASAYQVTDTKGNVLKLPRKPERIVTLALSSDAMVLAMVPPERMLALHYLADDPEISTIAGLAARIPVRMREYNEEMIIALKPDLVIAPDWNRADLIQTLRDMGIPVFVSKGPTSVEEVRQAIREIAAAINEPEAGKQIVEKMDAELLAVAEKVVSIPAERRQTLLLISHMPSYGGKGSLFDDVCRHAGVINGLAAIGLGKNDVLSKESIITMNPDLILTPTWRGGKMDVEKIKMDLLNDPALQTVKAIQQKRLAQVSDVYIYCASQDIVRAVRGIADAAYSQ